ncbi:MAG: hypothetical protein Q8N03_11275 [Ignavibacteria bacterium]|jgi:hypothetical protein|nr:hypothetical protein [Ignavibacteria bacterium]MDP3831874.1 hypothetical protein [Ignavibacteriaceae bacterium]
MKTGCFVKSLIIATIFLAAIIYIVTNKFDDFVKKPIQDFALNFALSEFNEKFDKIPETPQKLELDSLINSFAISIRDIKTIEMSKLEKLGVALNKSLKDSEISKDEISEIKSLIEEILRYEKRKKN